MEINKYHFKNTVRLTFGYKNGKFVQESKETISVPETDVKNYQPEVNIENE